MLLRQQAIQEYKEKYPNYFPVVEDGGFSGFGTHLETAGGKLLSKILDGWIYYMDKGLEAKKNGKRLESWKYFAKSLPYCALDGLLILPAGIEILVETGIRKLTGRTRF